MKAYYEQLSTGNEEGDHWNDGWKKFREGAARKEMNGVGKWNNNKNTVRKIY